MSDKICSLCEGKRRVQRRGYSTRCEPCDSREIMDLKQERDGMLRVLNAARNFVASKGDITVLVDAVIDFDMDSK
jgi:hypothetical protein